MRIREICEGWGIMTNSEERKFIKAHGSRVNLDKLDQHSRWVAKNLVRKGIYEVAKNGQEIYLKNELDKSIII